MTMRYTLSQGFDHQSTLVADVCATVDDQALEKLKRFMYEYGCASGLLFDEEVCLLLRDTFSEVGPASVIEERRIPTRVLLETLGPSNTGPLEVRVGRWLEILTTSWRAAIPATSEDALELIDDVVPAATGAVIHPWSAAA